MKKLILGVLLTIFLSSFLNAAVPTDLTAFFRSGQSFLTWTEVSGAGHYNIYSKVGSALTAGDLNSTNLRTSVIQGSAGNKTLFIISDADVTGWADWAMPKPLFTITRNVINPLDVATFGNADQVPEGTGMVVLTTKSAGNIYYAVTAVVSGVEDKSVVASNSFGAVVEIVEDPEPLLIYNSTTGQKRIYLSYTDIEEGNVSYGNMYAWPFQVGINASFGSATSRTEPLGLILLGMPSRLTMPNSTSYNPGISITPGGMAEWWFGWSESAVYDSTMDRSVIYTDPIVQSGPISNYAQERVMNFLEWIIYKDSYFSTRIDTNQIHVGGGSAGGGGTMQFALNYPDFFAYAAPSQGPTNYIGTPWALYANKIFGDSLNDAIDVQFRGYRSEVPNALWGNLKAYEYFTTEDRVLALEGKDIPFISLTHGGADVSVNWPQQGQNMYTNMNSTRQGFSGVIYGDQGHNACFCSCTEDCGTVLNWKVPQLSTIKKNEVYPAFSNSVTSSILPPPSSPDPTSQTHYNIFKIWSTSGYAVAGYQAQVDLVDRFEIVLADTASNDTCDITMRRFQNFNPAVGAKYLVRNTAVNDSNTVYQTDTIIADAFGLITFQNFWVKKGNQTSGGSRVIMTLFEAAVPVDVAITTTSLDVAGDGIAYSFQLKNSGNMAPFIWSLNSGVWPNGISMNSDGLISGTPTEFGNFNITIGVIDNQSKTDTKSLTLVVEEFPTAPGMPTLTVLGETSIQIDWTASTISSGSIASYNVYRDNSIIANVTASTLNYTDQGLAASTMYTYKVTALTSNGGEGIASSEASATTDASPILSGTNARSIGTNTGVVFSTGTVTNTSGNDTLRFSEDLPANVGEGDKIVINGSISEYILLKLDDKTAIIHKTNADNISGGTFEISRAYNLVSTWYADRKGDLVTDSRIEKGVCYADSKMFDNVVIDSAGTKTSSNYYFYLTVASSAKHNGIAGGFELAPLNDASIILVKANYTIIDGLELTGLKTQYKAAIEILGSDMTHVRNCLIHDFIDINRQNGVLINTYHLKTYVYNNIVYNLIPQSSNNLVYGIRTMGANTWSVAYNNTVINVGGSELYSKGYDLTSSTDSIYNNISLGNKTDYNFTTTTASNNISSDATGDIINKSFADLDFVSIIEGSEDYKIDENSIAKNTGIDLSTYYSKDILGYTRSAWDIGASEYSGSSIVFDESESLDLEKLVVTPNPFNPSTVIKFANPNKSIDLLIYNVKGNLVKSFLKVNGNSVTWNAKNQASGMYLLKAVSKKGILNKTLLLIK